MSEVTLKVIEDLLGLKLEEKLDTKLAPIQATLNKHSTMLDSLAKDVKILLNDKTITAHRLGRLEQWGQKVGEKTEITLEL